MARPRSRKSSPRRSRPTTLCRRPPPASAGPAGLSGTWPVVSFRCRFIFPFDSGKRVSERGLESKISGEAKRRGVPLSSREELASLDLSPPRGIELGKKARALLSLSLNSLVLHRSLRQAGTASSTASRLRARVSGRMRREGSLREAAAGAPSSSVRPVCRSAEDVPPIEKRRAASSLFSRLISLSLAPRRRKKSPRRTYLDRRAL